MKIRVLVAIVIAAAAAPAWDQTQVRPHAWQRLMNLPLPSLSLKTSEAALRVTRRDLKDATVFFIFNESGQALRNQVTLRVAEKSVEIWDAQTGTTRPQPEVSRGKEGLFLPVRLGPYEAQLIVARMAAN